MPEPDIGMLASAAGLAGVVWLVMQILRGPIPADVYDRWGATIAVVIGILFSLLYVLATSTALTGAVLLQAFLVGMFGGWFSQNVNNMVRRALATPPG